MGKFSENPDGGFFMDMGKYRKKSERESSFTIVLLLTTVTHWF